MTSRTAHQRVYASRENSVKPEAVTSPIREPNSPLLD
jgi:hypothetical protein